MSNSLYGRDYDVVTRYMCHKWPRICSVCHIDIIFQKLEEFLKDKNSNWTKKLKDNNSGKFLLYSKISENFELKKYIEFNLPKSLRSKLT